MRRRPTGVRRAGLGRPGRSRAPGLGLLRPRGGFVACAASPRGGVHASAVGGCSLRRQEAGIRRLRCAACAHVRRHAGKSWEDGAFGGELRAPARAATPPAPGAPPPLNRPPGTGRARRRQAGSRTPGDRGSYAETSRTHGPTGPRPGCPAPRGPVLVRRAPACRPAGVPPGRPASAPVAGRVVTERRAGASRTAPSVCRGSSPAGAPGSRPHCAPVPCRASDPPRTAGARPPRRTRRRARG